ncbi:tetratricopeptide repeat protein [Fulvivirga sediminis]|uniref:Tetratricopeptide repeat protein n=1 Tax=Fulvivirga sediminis TaxID=2803949 RepID=A0A937K1G5_9BACT|nr:tetratricopeptide repeat protein [Fulvivirga sediminis]MBL3658584.1 tetratricopeptide repeat protein [Fulvivirga sediminis]
MKYLVLTVLVMVSSSFGELDRIAKINKLKKEAKEAYNSGNFDKAIDNYHYLLDTLQMEDDNITLNLANAYFQKKDTTNALNNYESIINSDNKSVSSVAHQQMGIMANRSKKYEEALDHFKQALKADPTNEEARYNYEMVKKALEKQKQDQNNEDQNKDKNDENKDEQDKKDQENKDQDNNDKKDGDQENKDQENQDQKSDDEKGQEKDQQDKEGKPDEKDKEGDEQKKGEQDDTKKENADEKQQAGEENDKKKGDEENMSSVSKKLKEMNMPPEKAQMILEALKNKEIQYYQQNKHKATQPKSSGKPDW